MTRPGSREKRRVRVVLLLLLLVATGYLGHAQATDSTRNTIETYQHQATLPEDARSPVVDERANATVVTSRGMQAYPGTDALYVFSADGRLLYYENRTQYADVDPSPAGADTLQVAADRRGDVAGCEQRCSEQLIRLINYSTGETTDKYRYVTPGDRDSNWHDADRVGPDRYVIAGIYDDSLWVINTTTRIVEWRWSMQDAAPIEGAGPYPEDWAHMNDVERLPDGRIMASPRNHDQIVFIHPEQGLQEDWTLGCDDCFGTLYEQHNPDYIPEEQGGPAVLVADSENNRVIEYQRVNESWEQSWVYQDDRMDWPRDADRLPNGHTLITDTHENRVFEVDRDGNIVWEIHIPNGYEAERLGTGDESAGGPSAVRANLTSVGENTHEGGTHEKYANEGERTQWSKLKHGFQFVTPAWMGLAEFLLGLELVGVAIVWSGIELWWRGWRFRLPVTSDGGIDD